MSQGKNRGRQEKKFDAKKGSRARGKSPLKSRGEFWNSWRIATLIDWIGWEGNEPPWGAKRRSRPLPQAFEIKQLRAAWHGVMAHRAMIDWYGTQSGLDMTVAPGRRRALLWLVMGEGEPAQRIEAALGRELQLTPGETYALRALENQRLEQKSAPKAMPPAVRANLPDALYQKMERRFGPRLVAEMTAMNDVPPTVDLRVNPLRASRAEVEARLAAQGLRPRPMPYAPYGLRLPPFTDMGMNPALHEGLVEVQDEGSQLAAALVAAEAGQYVIDLCAGAGGKTLALAAAMQNKGRLVALDPSAERLDRAKSRLRRANVHNVELRLLPDSKWLKRQAGRVDRLLIDAPCSGSGSWRRKPEGRWRILPEALDNLRATQASLLDQGADLPKISGRIIYITCSLLIEEDEAIVEEFLKRDRRYRRLAARAAWGESLSTPYPGTDEGDLLLTPMMHGTDGFYIAILERIS